MILAPVTGTFAEAKETVVGKLIFDKMVGLVDGILKFISSELFRQFCCLGSFGSGWTMQFSLKPVLCSSAGLVGLRLFGVEG